MGHTGCRPGGAWLAGLTTTTRKEQAMVASSFSGARILITGGTGSFGHAMVRKLLHSDCGEIRILSRDEEKQDRMRREMGDERLNFYLGDVRNPTTVDRACRRVDYIFHAAALKQVPSCEFFPLEAVSTNILGSANVIEAAQANGVRSVVCLGTDKAVYPINAMGMTKALMEKVAQAFARQAQSAATVVATVRYGNVLYSRGSIVPLFVAQAKSHEPLTITDPNMTRFLMSLAEAVELVEHAFLQARPGDLFVRKAPASTIEVLASAVIALFGDGSSTTRCIGTRHGEKLYETLVAREEMARATDEGDFYRIPLDERGLNYESYFAAGNETVEVTDEYTSHNTQRLTSEDVQDVLQTIPEVQRELASSGKRSVS
jgi:UDP-glucose 4-epimerase